MAKVDIAKSAETSVSRPRDIFAAMRDEMDRVFERFETDWPRWPRLNAWPSVLWRTTGTELVVPELDVRENTKRGSRRPRGRRRSRLSARSKSARAERCARDQGWRLAPSGRAAVLLDTKRTLCDRRERGGATRWRFAGNR